MRTDLELANRALVRMGVHRQLTTLADGSPEAAALEVALPAVKERILSAHHWSWATVHKALVERTTLDEVPFGWGFAYDKPSDLLTPIEIWSGNRRPAAAARIPFQLGVGIETIGVPPLAVETMVEVVLTDVQAAELVYVLNTWTTARVPPIVDDALAWALAAELVMPITNNAKLALVVGQQAARALALAKAGDHNARQLDAEPTPRAIGARR